MAKYKFRDDIFTDKVKDELNKIYSVDNEPRNIVLYTGWMGMVMFDYAMQGLDINSGILPLWYANEKRGNQFSLYKKHSTFKARPNYKTHTLDFFIGTNYVFSSQKLVDFSNYLIKNNFIPKKNAK